MKIKILRILFLGLVLLHAREAFAADAKPNWQTEWEKTLAAAKREGKFNLYVGRYGTEPLLNEFRKEYPDIKIISLNGTGNQLGTRIVAEIRAGKVIADLFSGGANSNLTGIWSIRNGKENMFPRSPPAPGSAAGCNFTTTIRNWVLNLSSGSL